ncbi:MAG: hypothetical protein Kow0097_01070 [Candidatus Bipolaricaulota bacterium]|nr:GNAT family N-acetyltransferase [Candidatus Bipolaricaulota bacterium]
MGELVRLERPDVGQAVEVLATAFGDDPLLVHACPDREARMKLARIFCQVPLYYAARYGEVYASSHRLEGVAAWLPSAYYPLTPWRVLRAVPLSLLVGLGRAGGARLRVAGDHLDALHRRLAPPKHLFLLILGVAPPFQGQGHAGRLLRPILARLDREVRPCYVDTMQERNVSLYEHFGFRTLEESPVPGTDLTAWAMLRPPCPGTIGGPVR